MSRALSTPALLLFLIPSFVHAQRVPDSVATSRYVLLASEYVRAGNMAGAEKAYENAIREFSKGDPENFGSILDLAAAFYHEIGKYSQAESCIRRSISVWSKLLGPEHVRLAPVINRLACVYVETGRQKKTRNLNLEKWLARVADEAPEGKVHVNLLSTLGMIESRNGRFREAELYNRRALDILERHNAMQSVDAAALLTNFAITNVRGRNYDEAVKQLLRAATILEHKDSGNPFYAAVVSSLLARVYLEQRRVDEADVLFRDAVVVVERLCGVDSPRTGQFLADYASFLRARKRKDEAVAVEARARSIMQQSGAAAFARHKVDIGELGPR